MKYLKLFENFYNKSDNTDIVYHGTDKLHKFNNRGNMSNGTFFSEDDNEAHVYGQHIYEVTLNNNLKLFDSCNINDCKLLFKIFDVLYDTYYSEGKRGHEIKTAKKLANSSDTWEPLENTPGVLDWIENNYDGIWLYEGGVRNLLLFSPVKDKINNIKLFNESEINESSNKFNYDYIINALTKGQYGWGNSIESEIDNFEKSEGYVKPANDNDYILDFDKYLQELNKKPNFEKDDLFVKPPIEWYAKST